jgi:hypothetical protein
MPLTYEPCMPADICLTGEGYLVIFIGLIIATVIYQIASVIIEVKPCKEKSKP